MGLRTLRQPPALATIRGWGKGLAVLWRAPKIPTFIVIVSVVVAIFAPLIAPHSPIDPNLVDREKPPIFLEGSTLKYPLGTDRQGRDVLSRITVGARVSLSVAAMAIVLGSLAGVSLGLLAGYRGGWVDALTMRTMDVMLAFPPILIALVFAVTVGPSFWVVVAVLGLMMLPRYARLVRGDVLTWKQRDFVALARIAGCSSTRIIIVHLFPNVVASLVVLSTLQIGWAIVVEASLSFLGAGIPPPTPTWGGMVSEGRNYLESLWWISVFPGIAIMLVVLSFNMFGDWLRDILDPRLRQL